MSDILNELFFSAVAMAFLLPGVSGLLLPWLVTVWIVFRRESLMRGLRAPQVAMLLTLLFPVLRLDRDAGLAGQDAKVRFALAAVVWLGLSMGRRTKPTLLLMFFFFLTISAFAVSFAPWLNALARYKAVGLGRPDVFRQPLSFFLRAPYLSNPVAFYLSGLSVALSSSLSKDSDSSILLTITAMLTLLDGFIISLTFSRAAYFAAIGLVIATLYLGVKRRSARSIVLLLLSAILIIVAHIWLKTAPSLFAVLALFVSPLQSVSAEGHARAIQYGMRELVRAGMFGFGTRGTARQAIGNRQVLNMFLEFACSYGWLALAAGSVATAGIIVTFLKHCRSDDGSRMVMFFGALSICFYGLLWSNPILDEMSLISSLVLLNQLWVLKCGEDTGCECY